MLLFNTMSQITSDDKILDMLSCPPLPSLQSLQSLGSALVWNACIVQLVCVVLLGVPSTVFKCFLFPYPYLIHHSLTNHFTKANHHMLSYTL